MNIISEKIDDYLFDNIEWFWRFLHWFTNIPATIRRIKWFFQKIFRKGHYSDFDLWGLDYHLAGVILPKLIAFRNQDLNSYPNDFCDWDENLHRTKEEYDKKNYIGGGMERWLEYIDEMIFAFSFILYHEDMKRNGDVSKKAIKFYKEFGIENPWVPSSEEEEKRHIKHGSYYNDEVNSKNYERCQRGLELFGKFYLSLWD